MRAAAIEHTNLTTFILNTAIEAAQSAIDRAERISLSETDTLKVLALLGNPPSPNEKLLAAAKALPKE
ncbi:hypothetical protein ABENE_10985 [Asticcacaulis benevestitus DSM 16100 = ATCC BAA-896]|uniref:DUF1778 domain-containing protein n=2 Tax=Asticcacaulis TaxID=76890 RepID=V4PAM9_9CAUL|nr:hypothetical protein ABENE_10985 [Asticcacaulis benevestitus DSM 16100 = ATCC BAA-896]